MTEDRASDGGGTRSHDWEPIGRSDIDLLARLVTAETVLEGGVGEILRMDGAADVALGELVAWAWVVDDDRSHVLLVDHRRRGVWMPPGGRAARGEYPAAASARELFEETGVRGALVHQHPVLVDAVASTAPDGTAVMTLGVAFLFAADRSLPLTPETGQAAAWWPLAAAPQRRAEHHWRRVTRELAAGR
jgi:ADP-ribose pyrophosphatase YjhB (NUDIX family)